MYPLTIWDLKTGNQVGQPLDVNTDQYIVFSSDGKMLALRRQNKSITLLNLETGQPFGHSLRGYVDSIVGLIFSPDGTLLVAGGDDVHALQEKQPKTLIQETCERVGRNFTQAEWGQYFPGEEYRKTCSQWPARE